MIKYDMISARQARRDMDDNDALLVCAYEDNQQFSNNALEKAISMKEFKGKEEALDKDREIIVYCGSQGSGSSVEQAEKLFDRGFTNVKVIKDGVQAWRDEGYPFML